MRLFRGRAPTIATDSEVSERMCSLVATGETAVRVWIPHRQVAFGRRDARLEGYDRARAAASEHGFPPVERSVGGRAVAFDGETTVAVARAEPVDDSRRGIGDRYDRLTRDLERALDRLGVETTRGEPPDSFCPGSHSLSASLADGRGGEDGTGGSERKLAGLAQRVRTDAALVSGILVVDHRSELAGVLEAVYDALEVPFDPSSVGSVAAAGGPSDPDRVVAALEDELVGDVTPTLECVDR
ncbi:lipoyl protein ligase domain-containing protein [Natronoglomus mannanivorans]|uniref:Lipoate--protein ligase family protein n=1 Tax=Natronoglomus mannanivorans TaxID=2979990 RepID=A0AAP2YYB3_9EURY|nr:lipoate--protein ligase family protein [Halobacteria archaeon AArc-xg1-1]